MQHNKIVTRDDKNGEKAVASDSTDGLFALSRSPFESESARAGWGQVFAGATHLTASLYDANAPPKAQR